MQPKAIIPAIDIMGGRCVRLFKGASDQATVYNDDPLAQLESFVASGAHRIHIVDLDAAFGRGDNRPLFSKMRAQTSAILEIGGGIRTEEDITFLLDMGIDYVILGSALIKSPEAVQRWAQRYENRIIAGIDEKDGVVQIAGWQMKSQMQTHDLVEQVCSWGIQQIIFTNTERDGTLEGPDIERTNAIAEIAESHDARIILSGGIASQDDISAVVKQGHQAISGIITGKAVYEDRIDLAELIAEQNKNSRPVIVRMQPKTNATISSTVCARGNTKSYKKTLEEGHLWVVHETTGRVLPYPEKNSLAEIIDQGQWYAARLIVDDSEDTSSNTHDATQVSNKDPQTKKNQCREAVMHKLCAILEERKLHPKQGSYSSYLFVEGESVIRKKLAEEAIEIALATTSEELIAECGDLLYHLCALLVAKDLDWDAVMDELAKRQG